MIAPSTDVQVKIRRTAARIRGEQAFQSDNKPYQEQLSLCDWITTTFWIPERSHLPPEQRGLDLAPYQRVTLDEAQRRGEDGKFVYDLVLWSDIKKSAKSSIAGAVILYRALNTPWGSFKIVANDLKQADSRVFYYIRRAIELNPELSKRATIKNYKITLDNNAVIEAIPVDPKGEAGGNDDMIEFTELHAADGRAAASMWAEMTISPTKHGYSQRWIDTYAGHSGESPLLEPLYQRGVKEGAQLDLGIEGLEVYANGRMLVLWNTQPRLEWQTAEYYASEAAVLLPHEYERMHRNQWVTSQEVFVPTEWWDACRSDEQCPQAASVVVGVDAAVSGDCFAVVGVSRIEDTVYVRFAHIWKPPKGGALDFAEPEGFLREMGKQYNIVQFAYDPYQLHDMATRMRKTGSGWWRPFAQGQERLVADKALYDNIRDRRIRHNGNADLREHVANANSKTEGDKLRIVKRAEHLKIDACVALSMAHAECRRLLLT